MEDYDVDDGLLVYEPSLSDHPAHTFRISTRDLARFGQLFLEDGRWNGAQIVPAEWIAESTHPVTDFGNGTGYGLMWWTYDAGSLGAPYPRLNEHDLYMARGTGGQALYVIPDADLVIVHRGDTDNGREVPGRDAWRIAELILAARAGEPSSNPEIVPVVSVPFESQLPALSRDFVELDAETWAHYYGEYEIAPGAVARVYEWQRRRFGFFPGQGEAELFALGDDRFTVQVVAGVEIRFERNEDGEVEGMEVRIGPEVIRGVKQ
jgi:hypothetical protein